jgi:hypothetical protein
VQERQPAFLLGLTGLHIDGGIASVSRSVARVLDAEAASGALSRVDRVLLLEDPERPAAPPVRSWVSPARWKSRSRAIRHETSRSSCTASSSGPPTEAAERALFAGPSACS